MAGYRGYSFQVAHAGANLWNTLPVDQHTPLPCASFKRIIVALFFFFFFDVFIPKGDYSGSIFDVLIPHRNYVYSISCSDQRTFW